VDPRPWFSVASTAIVLVGFALVWVVDGTPWRGGGLIDPARLIELGGLAPVRCWMEGEWWRLLSHAALHGAWWHAAFNAYALWLLGRWSELSVGRWWTVGVFVTAVLAGGMLTVALPEGGLMVGASGGIYGLGGFALVRGFLSPGSMEEAPVSRGSLAFWLGVGLGLGWFFEGVSFAGHFGGGLVGALAGAVRETRTRWLRAMCAGALACVIGALGWGALNPLDQARADAMVGFAHLDADRPDRAIGPLERAISSGREDPSWLNALAYALALERSQLPRARSLAVRADELEPENPDILDTLGLILCLEGRTDAGRGVLERALQLDPDLAEAREHLADCADR
jgi:membrane associated rhomboid family serine protease